MTTDKGFKRLVRARAARTGESYAAARRSLVAKAGATTVHDLWFTRASQGYSGRRAAKPHGYEHHVVAVSGVDVSVETHVAFTSYGVQRYRIEAGRGTSHFVHDGRGVQVEAAVDDAGAAWAGAATVADAGDATPFRLPLPAGGGDPVLPSTVARFLPAVAGAGTTFVVVPEDGFPAWRPPGRGSWFPVMGVRSAAERRVLVAAPGGPTAPTRIDHVLAADPSTVRASTWLDEAGEVVRYEQPGLVLVRVSEEEAVRRGPTDLT